MKKFNFEDGCDRNDFAARFLFQFLYRFFLDCIVNWSAGIKVLVPSL